MHKFISYIASGLFLGLVSSYAIADVIDPEKHVLKNGHHSAKIGDDGKTRFYSFTERAASTRIAALETEIAKLPKHVEVQKMCDFMRDGTKARGIAFDVAVTNYGYSGATIACVLKYTNEANVVGTQLIFSKKGAGGMYMVFVTD